MATSLAWDTDTINKTFVKCYYYDYTITLIERNSYLLLKNGITLILQRVPSLVEIGSSTREKIFKFRQYLFTISLSYIPLKKGRGSVFEQTWIPVAQGCFVPSLVELENFFLFRQCISLFRYYLPLKKGVALHSNKLVSPSPKDALCQVWLSMAQWFLRRRWKWE